MPYLDIYVRKALFLTSKFSLVLRRVGSTRRNWGIHEKPDINTFNQIITYITINESVYAAIWMVEETLSGLIGSLRYSWLLRRITDFLNSHIPLTHDIRLGDDRFQCIFSLINTHQNNIDWVVLLHMWVVITDVYDI